MVEGKPSPWAVDVLYSLSMAITFEDVMNYLRTAPARDPQLDRVFFQKYFGVTAPWILDELRDEGRASLLVRLFERRLARPLSNDEHATFGKRLKTVGLDRLGDVVLELSPQDLAAWLADPNAK